MRNTMFEAELQRVRVFVEAASHLHAQGLDTRRILSSLRSARRHITTAEGLVKKGIADKLTR